MLCPHPGTSSHLISSAFQAALPPLSPGRRLWRSGWTMRLHSYLYLPQPSLVQLTAESLQNSLHLCCDSGGKASRTSVTEICWLQWTGVETQEKLSSKAAKGKQKWTQHYKSDKCCAQSFSRVRLSATPWTVARQPPSWDSPGKNIGVGCRALLQGIFPTQGWNPGLPHCRQIV